MYLLCLGVCTLKNNQKIYSNISPLGCSAWLWTCLTRLLLLSARLRWKPMEATLNLSPDSHAKTIHVSLTYSGILKQVWVSVLLFPIWIHTLFNCNIGTMTKGHVKSNKMTAQVVSWDQRLWELKSSAPDGIRTNSSSVEKPTRSVPWWFLKKQNAVMSKSKKCSF